ncbi:MAG: hypothetical protein WC236_00190 [Gallionellaceae bacterium]|jgi:hypothetical protein
MKIKFSLTLIVVLILIGTVSNVFAAINGLEISQRTGVLWYLILSYLVTLAVEADRKSRKIPAPFEYAALVFFAWPFVLPYYLYSVHKLRGLLLSIGFILFTFIPDFATIVTYLLIEG